MEFIDNQSNTYKSENAMIDLNNERIAAKDIQIYFPIENQPMFLSTHLALL